MDIKMLEIETDLWYNKRTNLSNTTVKIYLIVPIISISVVLMGNASYTLVDKKRKPTKIVKKILKYAFFATQTIVVMLKKQCIF